MRGQLQCAQGRALTSLLRTAPNLNSPRDLGGYPLNWRCIALPPVHNRVFICNAMGLLVHRDDCLLAAYTCARK